MKFYSHVCSSKNNIIHFWYDENGKKHKSIVKFKPSIAIETSKETEFKNIYGQNLGVIQFDNPFELSHWKKENEKYIDVYNDVGIVYEFISETYKDELLPDYKLLKIFNIDIECVSDSGFPLPSESKYPINSITIQDYYKDDFYVFGYQDYTPKKENVTYIKCEDEFDLGMKFVDFFSKSKPDIITGFNTEGFDIPYLINRFKLILPKGEYYKLSPVNEIRPYKISDNLEGYRIIGVSHLDFQKLYKLMNLKKLDSYSLDSIAQVEIHEGKLDFRKQGYTNHYDFYNRNFESFIDYNIIDVELVSKINRKKRFIEIVLSQAYMAKVNHEDALGSVKPWDIYVYNENKKKGILAQPKKDSQRVNFPGGYVKEPVKGFHDWIIVADIASSYPNNIISVNISPETLVDRSQLPEELKAVQDEFKKQYWGDDGIESTGFIDVENIEHITKLLKKYNLSLSANGEFFKSNQFGIFPQMVEKVYQDRKDKKKEMKSYWNQMKEYEKGSEEYTKLENKWAAADNIQYSLKIFLNSFFGVFANPYFRFSDVRLASAVTINGQMVVKGPKYYVEKKMPLITVDYTDTDSCFFNVSKILKDRYKDKYDVVSMEEKREFCIMLFKKVISPLIKEYYEKYTSALNFIKNSYEMDMEVIADKSLFIGKKRYIMNLVYDEGDLYSEDESKLKVRGVEINRTNTPMLIRKKLEELVKMIIKTQDNDMCLKFINNFKKEYMTLPFEVIARPTGVKGMNEYKIDSPSVPIHVRASKVYNEAIKTLNLSTLQTIENGEKIRYVYIKEPNIFNSNVIACVDEIPQAILDKIEIDYNTQFDKTCMSPVKMLFDPLDWKTEKVASLQSFF